MSSVISRRHVLAAPLVLAGCATASPYFGRTTPPASQRLVYSNGEEPSSLDPAQSVGSRSEIIMTALLDSLTAFDPLTLQPAAALATHYHVDTGGTQYTFFLRGHPKPRGIGSPIRIRCPGSSRVGIRRRPTGFRRCGVTAPRSQLTILSIRGAGSWTGNGSVYGGLPGPRPQC